jgi:hypothetical protein
MVSPDSRLRTCVFIWCLRCFESRSLFASDLGSGGLGVADFWACWRALMFPRTIWAW